MESEPMGMRLNRSHKGFPSLNIRTSLSSWIRHWTQHSYTQNSQYPLLPCLLLLLLLLSSMMVPTPLVIRFANSICLGKPKAIGVHPR